MSQPESTQQNTLPLVSVLATGGTIAGRALRQGSVAEYTPGDISARDLLDALPQVAGVARIRCRQVANIGSEDMTDAVWFDLARAVAEEREDGEVRGVVVLHGTDTMEETAVFLDLLIGGGAPVVLTGAMRPADAVSADGPANILAAVRVAADAGSAGRGVLVVMNDVIHRARHVTKTDTLALDTFRSRGCGPEGRVVDGRVCFTRQGGVREGAAFSLAGVEELPRVEIVYGHAGMTRGVVEAVVGSGAWGIVYAGVGMGNIHSEVRGVLAAAAAGGVVVACSSRVGGGPAPLTEKMRRDGFVSAGDLNPQKARVALRMALTRTSDAREVQRVFDAYR